MRRGLTHIATLLHMLQQDLVIRPTIKHNMQIVTYIHPVNKDSIANAVQIMRGGQLAAFATETVYGLGADATSDEAVARIFATKERPQFNPLIAHVSSVAMAQTYVQWNDMAQILAETFWPGALTLVLPRARDSKLSLLVSAGLDSVGVRMPSHVGARQLIEALGVPIAAPSANRSGRISPTTAQHVMEELGGKIPLILDGGPCRIGLESTVVDLTADVPVLLRHGGITHAKLESAIGPVAFAGAAHPQASPGMMQSHYAPQAKLRLNAQDIKQGEVFLGFGDISHGAFNLSPRANLTEAAANLFSMLRDADQPGITCIAVAPIPERDLGEAINDRLQRAAAGR